ncbi:MAG: peptidoglycan DD-metalloendopeptidase family protein [Paracoccaceae bacterium]
MTAKLAKNAFRMFIMGASVLTLAACENDGRFDGDLRHFGKGIFDTSDAVAAGSAVRPAPDQRGVISYPGYQVALARRGDTVTSVAARVGLPAEELASYNAINAAAVLREGEVLALPRRVPEAGAAAGVIGTASLPPATASGGTIDVQSIASNAIEETKNQQPAKPTPISSPPIGNEPLRHKVLRGETAYSIARQYNVNVRSLADWNGLNGNLDVREGQILLIPTSGSKAPKATEVVTAPGEGSATPEPPSAKKPLPEEKTTAASEPVETPPAPDLATTATAGKLAMPVKGKIIRGYQKKKNDGIDIGAAAGTAVAAAGDGAVAAITKDTEGVPILVLRHADNLLTVYANIDAIAVKKGDKVSRGQTIAKVRGSEPAFLHFEVRQGFDSVDPMPYLQ